MQKKPKTGKQARDLEESKKTFLFSLEDGHLFPICPSYLSILFYKPNRIL